MINIISKNYSTNYCVFAVDTVAELDKLPTVTSRGKDNLAAISCISGSRAIVTETSERYILNGQNKWILDKKFGCGCNLDTLTEFLNLRGFQYLFYECNTLTEVPEMDTSSAINMKQMFYNCTNLASVPEMDTSNVTDMSSMFLGCSSLTSIPEMDTSNVTTMTFMYTGCSSLLQIPNMDTSKVTDMRSTFKGCSSITTIPALDTSNVTTMGAMFDGCKNLISVPVLDTQNVDNMTSMFNDCSSLVNAPEMDMQKVLGTSNMFSGCTNLVTVPKLNTNNVTNMSTMFCKCENLVSIKGLDLSSVTKTTSMFSFCTKLTELNLTHISISLSLSDCTLLSVGSLVNVIQQLITSSSSKTLTIGSENLGKINGLYCKILNDSSDIKPMTLCNSSDSGAMSLIEYANKKNWQVK